MIADRRDVLRLGFALAVLGAAPARAITYAPPDYWIYFEPDSAELPPVAMQVIIDMKPAFDGWVKDSGAPPRYRITGSIDGVEEKARRTKLAGQRVKAVADAMVTNGVDRAQIIVTEKIPGLFAPTVRGQPEPLARAVFVELDYTVRLEDLR